MRTAISSVSLMASFSTLTNVEIADLGAYMSSLTPAAPVGNAANGEALYTSKNCLGCHGANRQGVVGPALTKSALTAKYSTAAEVQALVKSMSKFGSVTSDTEALDITTFLLQ